MRILLVEDTEDVGEAIVARFERIGHTVDWEKDGGVANPAGGEFVILPTFQVGLKARPLRRVEAVEQAQPTAAAAEPVCYAQGDGPLFGPVRVSAPG